MRPTTVIVPAKTTVDLAYLLGVTPDKAAEIWAARGKHPVLRAALLVPSVFSPPGKASASTKTSDAVGSTPITTSGMPDEAPVTGGRTSAPKTPPKPPKPPVKRGRIMGRAMSASSLSAPEVRKAALRELGPDERVVAHEDIELLAESKVTSGLDAGHAATLDATTPSVRWDKPKLLEYARARNVNVSDDMPKNTILRKIREKIG